MSVFTQLIQVHEPLLRSLGIDEATQTGLGNFLDLVWTKNKDLNLVSRKMTPQALVDDHLMDALIGLNHLPNAEVIADLGSGGGFPAVPLAICRPQTRFLLFEKSPLKCRYLKILEERLPNITVKGPLASNSLDDGVGLVIARAFKPLQVILEMTAAYHKRGGAYCLFKARKAKILEELRLAGLREDDVRIVPLEPAGSAEERHLVFL